jgi:acyl carrier protein
LDAMPLTPSRKIDRNALPAPTALHQDRVGDCYTPPVDALELQLTQIWEHVLKRRPVGTLDNFFDLGGHSLMAAALMDAIHRNTGTKLPLSALFATPTIKQLAHRMRDVGWSSPWSSIVPIQPGGSRPPFFCASPGGNQSLYYRDLARHLGSDQPFFGLECPLENESNQRVEDLAAEHIQGIRAIQPQGPYFLGGLCFGGIVAFEMARQLREQGELVALVALVDTYTPEYVGEKTHSLSTRLPTRSRSAGTRQSVAAAC